jgi:hypothetical protein
MLRKATQLLAYYLGAIVSCGAVVVVVVVFDAVVAGAIVSFNFCALSAVPVLDVNLTDGCVVDELSLVHAAKQIAMVKAAKESWVIFFTFVII